MDFIFRDAVRSVEDSRQTKAICRKKNDVDQIRPGSAQEGLWDKKIRPEWFFDFVKPIYKTVHLARHE